MANESEWHKQLLTMVKELLTSGRFSDLTVVCGSDVYKVHKNIVCSRADFFARAIKFGGKEAEMNEVKLPDDEPAIIKLLIQYLYEGEYEPKLPVGGSPAFPKWTSIPASTSTMSKETNRLGTEKALFSKTSNPFPFHTCDPAINGSATQLLTHAKMYEVGDKYDVTGLKDLATEKFRRACVHFWDDPSFAIAAHRAFSTTPDHDKGLRDIISKTIADHTQEMIRKPEIEALLIELNGLAFGLLKAKVGVQ